MDTSKFADVIKNWKTIAGGVIFIIATTWSFIGWSQSQTRDMIIESELRQKAVQTVIHDKIFQESRINRKEIERAEHERELDNLLSLLDEDEPTRSEQRRIAYLSEQIDNLTEDIEAIQRELEKSLLDEH